MWRLAFNLAIVSSPVRRLGEVHGSAANLSDTVAVVTGALLRCVSRQAAVTLLYNRANNGSQRRGGSVLLAIISRNLKSS